MTAVGADTREEVLRIATSITSEKHDPVAVVRSAVPMLAWLEQAADDNDLTRRLSALDRMWANLRRDESCNPEPAVPQEFLCGAEIFYLFATGDPEIPDGMDTGGDS